MGLGDTAVNNNNPTSNFTSKRIYIPRAMTGSMVGITSRYEISEKNLDHNMNVQTVKSSQVKPRERSASALINREVDEDLKMEVIERCSLRTAPGVSLSSSTYRSKKPVAALRPPVPKPRSQSLLLPSDVAESFLDQLTGNKTTHTEYKPTPSLRTVTRDRSSSACETVTSSHSSSSHDSKPPTPLPRPMIDKITKVPSIEVSDLGSPEEVGRTNPGLFSISRRRFFIKRNSDTSDRHFMGSAKGITIENQLEEQCRSRSLNSMNLRGILKSPSFCSMSSETTSDIQYNRPRSHSKVRFEEVIKEHMTTKKEICYDDENTDPKKRTKVVTDPWAIMSMSVKKPARNDSKEINKLRQQRAKQMSASLKDLRHRSASFDRAARSAKGKEVVTQQSRFASEEKLHKNDGRSLWNFKLNGGIFSSLKTQNSI